MAQAKTDNSTHAPAAEKPQDSIYLPTDITPEQLFRAIGKLRKDARDEIDRLIRFLDETDNHMELEPEDEGDDADAEPSLGSLGDHHFNQERWAAGNSRDLEQDDGETGIADQDGLDEQVPFRDWQGVGMV